MMNRVGLRRQNILVLCVVALTSTTRLVAAKPLFAVSLQSPQLTRTRRTQEKHPTIHHGGDDTLAAAAQAQKLSSKQYTTRWPLSALGYAKLSPCGLILLASALYTSYANFSTIPKRHLVFAVLYPLYLGVINRLRFQCNQPALEKQSKDVRVIPNIKLLWQEQGPWFRQYLCTFGLWGLLWPCLFCSLAPKVIAEPAISHYILILAQVVTEEMSHGPWMHMLPTLLVPIGFNAYRMGSLCEWVRGSWGLVNKHASFWTVLGFVLGVANLIMWTYNLFVFLLLRVTPQYWDIDTFPISNVKWQRQLWPKVVED